MSIRVVKLSYKTILNGCGGIQKLIDFSAISNKNCTFADENADGWRRTLGPYFIIFTMAYLFLTLAIILETAGTVCIKLSDGFTKPLPVVGTCLAYIACFYFLSLSLKTIPLGISYAVWAGLGIVLGNIISVVFFGQKFDFAAGIGVTLIVAGVVVLNLFSAASAHWEEAAWVFRKKSWGIKGLAPY